MKSLKVTLSIISLFLSAHSLAAKPLSDKELRAATEIDTAPLKVSEILQCPKDMEKVKCERLQTLRYASEGQTQNSYKLFLNGETQNPLSNQVIRQPLLTQPLKQP